MPTTLLLIRHGMNNWVKGRLAGWTPGVHLNDEGRAQATALGARLASLPLAAVYSSPLERTIETAEAIAAPHNLTVQIAAEIGEVRYGEWQGAEIKELAKFDLWQGVQFYPSGTRFPGGENLGQVQMRAVQALDHLRDQHPDQMIAAVAHADLIKLVIAYYIGMHVDLFQRLVINTASVTAIAFYPPGPRLLAFNDTGSLDHLKPDSSSEPTAPLARDSAPPEAANDDAPTAGAGDGVATSNDV